MAHAFERVVVEVNVRQLDFALRQRLRVHGKVVIMGRDLNLSGIELLYRMISAVVSKFEFESLAAEGDADQLMTEANSKDWLAPH